MDKFKKCKVILLPTGRASVFGNVLVARKDCYVDLGRHGVSFDKGDKISISNREDFYGLIEDNYNSFEPHNLYVVSNDEIEVKDSFISITDRRPTSLIDMPYICEDVYHKKSLQYHDTWRKVIASSDKSDWVNSVSKSFIEKYCSTEGGINEVLVKYVRNCNCVTCTYQELKGDSGFHSESYSCNYSVYTKRGGLISIQPIKTNWTKAELDKEIVEFSKRHHGVLNSSDLQTLVKFVGEL